MMGSRLRLAAKGRAIESLNSAVDIVTLALSGLIPDRPTFEALLIRS